MRGYLRFKGREWVSCWDQACLYEKEFGLWQLAGLYTVLVLKHLHLVLFLSWRSLVRWLLREVVSRCGQRGPCVADLLRGHVRVFWSFASPEMLFLIMIHCLLTTSKVNCMLGSFLHFLLYFIFRCVGDREQSLVTTLYLRGLSDIHLELYGGQLNSLEHRCVSWRWTWRHPWRWYLKLWK